MTQEESKQLTLGEQITYKGVFRPVFGIIQKITDTYVGIYYEDGQTGLVNFEDMHFFERGWVESTQETS